MKNKKFIYKLNMLFIIISLIGFSAFLIAGLIIQNKGGEYIYLFVLAGAFLLFTMASIFLICKYAPTKNDKELTMKAREKNLSKMKNKDKAEYSINLENASLEQDFDILLERFESEKLKNGKLYYRASENIYNKKRASCDVFYLFDASKNSFDLDSETKSIEKQAKKVCSFLTKKGYDADFVNCVFVFNHDSLDDTQKDFYCKFCGYWNSNIKGSDFTKNQFFTYLGIDSLTKNVYFHTQIKENEEKEVDLSYLIIKELKLN